MLARGSLRQHEAVCACLRSLVVPAVKKWSIRYYLGIRSVVFAHSAAKLLMELPIKAVGKRVKNDIFFEIIYGIWRI